MSRLSSFHSSQTQLSFISKDQSSKFSKTSFSQVPSSLASQQGPTPSPAAKFNPPLFKSAAEKIQYALALQKWNKNITNRDILINESGSAFDVYDSLQKNNIPLQPPVQPLTPSDENLYQQYHARYASRLSLSMDTTSSLVSAVRSYRADDEESIHPVEEHVTETSSMIGNGTCEDDNGDNEDEGNKGDDTWSIAGSIGSFNLEIPEKDSPTTSGGTTLAEEMIEEIAEEMERTDADVVVVTVDTIPEEKESSSSASSAVTKTEIAKAEITKPENATWKETLRNLVDDVAYRYPTLFLFTRESSEMNHIQAVIERDGHARTFKCEHNHFHLVEKEEAKTKGDEPRTEGAEQEDMNVFIPKRSKCPWSNGKKSIVVHWTGTGPARSDGKARTDRFRWSYYKK